MQTTQVHDKSLESMSLKRIKILAKARGFEKQQLVKS